MTTKTEYLTVFFKKTIFVQRYELSQSRQHMSQRLVKLAASLQHKKFRTKEKLFVAEGEKLVIDLLKSFSPRAILCSEDWAQKHKELNTNVLPESSLKKASSLKNNTPVVGIFEIPEEQDFKIEELPALVLDTLQDPGNMGTIIRTAAWFGIRHIICSPETVDIYNPKVVQATMGALSMVNVHYLYLPPFLAQLKEQNIAIMGTFLEGKSIYKTRFQKKSVIVVGNEGQGISKEVSQYVNLPIHIPSFGQSHPESLNASVSAAVVCSELARTTQS